MGNSDNLNLKGVWVSKILQLTIKEWYWNNYRGMKQLKTLDCGKRWSKQNMVSLLTGNKNFWQMHMELIYEKASVNFGLILLRTSHLEWENGSHIKFWKDIWLGDLTLGEELPSWTKFCHSIQQIGRHLGPKVKEPTWLYLMTYWPFLPTCSLAPFHPKSLID